LNRRGHAAGALAAIALLGCLGAAAGPAADPDTTTARGTLLAATRALHDGWASGNTAVLEPLIATDYALIDSRGRRLDRAAVLAAARRHDVDLERTESALSELHVTLAGTAGVVTGVTDEYLHFTAREEHRRRRFTEVWVATADGWQLLATHESGAEFSRVSQAPVSRDRSP